MNLYAILGGIIVALGLGAAALFYRGEATAAAAERDRAMADLALAVTANDEARRTIDALQEQSRMDSRLTAQLVQQIQEVNKNLTAQNTALNDLERLNVAVKAYLDAVVPDDLRKLYEH